jgi:hypothetical protein
MQAYASTGNSFGFPNIYTFADGMETKGRLQKVHSYP